MATYLQMSKADRAKVREAMVVEAEGILNRRVGLRLTLAQVKAGARKMVDQALANQRKAEKACLN